MERKLTGNARFRSERSFFGRERIILQVEEGGLLGEKPVAGSVDSHWRSRWRDARTEDLTGIQGFIYRERERKS